MEEGLLPAIFLFIIVIIFLLIALYFSFYPGNGIPVEKTEHIRDKFIYHENIDSINMTPSIQPINYKILSNKKGEINNVFSEIFFVVGDIELNEQLIDKCLIEFNYHEIHNIRINYKSDDNITIYIWNNSNTIKGIKILYPSVKMITLKPNIFISLFYTNGKWEFNNMSEFEENSDIYNKYLMKRCETLMESYVIKAKSSTYKIVDDFNILISSQGNFNSDTIKIVSNELEKIISELNDYYYKYDTMRAEDIINNLMNMNGCIFADCNFLTNNELILNLNNMIDKYVVKYKDNINETIEILNFTYNNYINK